MKKLAIDYTTGLEFSGPVSQHQFMLRCMPQENERQHVGTFTMDVQPDVWSRLETDCFGNRVLVGRCVEPHDHFTWSVHAEVQVGKEDYLKGIPSPLYRYPSKFCAPGNAIDAMVEEAKLSLSCGCCPTNPLGVATYLMNMLFERFEYVPGVTNVRTTAEEALSGGRGVCQDYAHILIACCRKMGISARYVAGLLVGEGASHAWVEVNDNDLWIGLDPTHNKLVDDCFVTIASGRDYSDCILDIGVFKGNGVFQTQTVIAKVTEA